VNANTCFLLPDLICHLEKITRMNLSSLEVKTPEGIIVRNEELFPFMKEKALIVEEKKRGCQVLMARLDCA